GRGRGGGRGLGFFPNGWALRPPRGGGPPGGGGGGGVGGGPLAEAVELLLGAPGVWNFQKGELPQLLGGLEAGWRQLAAAGASGWGRRLVCLRELGQEVWAGRLGGEERQQAVME
ncbi:MAG: hypothetical protein ACH34U_05930, partial [Cyanobium sp.]